MSVEQRSIYSGPIRRALQRLDGQINGGNNSGGHLDDRYVNVTGDTMPPPAELSFGALNRQMINLYNASYGIGIQNSTAYFRTGNQFAWHRGGSHSQAQCDPGPGGTLVMATTPGGHLVLGGKSDSNANAVGAEVHATGRVWTVTDTSVGYNVVCNIINGANAQVLTDFRRNNARIGWIVLNGTTGVLYQSASDYRLKDVLGPVAEPIERIKRLRPVHFAWKADGRKQDGFLAHEVAEVVPQAVSGDKDAVDENGEVKPQGLDNGQLVPLLVAAVQQQQAQIEQLQRRIDILEAAA